MLGFSYQSSMHSWWFLVVDKTRVLLRLTVKAWTVGSICSSCTHVNNNIIPIFTQDSTLAAMLLRPGPLLAITSARFAEDSVVDKVPRVYFRTLHDHVVKPGQQEAMVKRWPPSEVYVLDSDHSPMFSTPFLLFGFLVKSAASFGGLK